MRLSEEILRLAGHDVSMDIMTMVLRADGYSDEEIAQAYDEVAAVTTTEVVRGIPYIKLRNT